MCGYFFFLLFFSFFSPLFRLLLVTSLKFVRDPFWACSRSQNFNHGIRQKVLSIKTLLASEHILDITDTGPDWLLLLVTVESKLTQQSTASLLKERLAWFAPKSEAVIDPRRSWSRISIISLGEPFLCEMIDVVIFHARCDRYNIAYCILKVTFLAFRPRWTYMSGWWRSDRWLRARRWCSLEARVHNLIAGDLNWITNCKRSWYTATHQTL